LLARRSYAFKMGWPILARFVDYAVAGNYSFKQYKIGVPPNIMGIGPSEAIPVLLDRCGVKKEEINIYEINEAFAS